MRIRHLAVTKRERLYSVSGLGLGCGVILDRKVRLHVFGAGSSGYRPTHHGIRVGTLGTRSGERDERHSHSRHAGQGTREGDACELRRAANRRLRTPEHASNRRHEVQKDEACEQHRERTDPALPLVVMRPVRPLLIYRGVVVLPPARRRMPLPKPKRSLGRGPR